MKKALLVMVLVLSIGSGAMAGWTGAVADRNVSYLTIPEPSFVMAQYARAAVGPEGNIYLVWRQGGGTGFPAPPYEIYFGKSTDNGATWSSETADRYINAQDGQHACGSPVAGERPLDMDMDNSGNLYVVWAESLGTTDAYEIMLLKSTDQGETWIHSDADFPVSYTGVPNVNAYDPSLGIDYDNNMYVVWHQNAPSGHAEIHISKSTDGGDTWTGSLADRIISLDDGYAAANPDIVIDRNNNIYVVWAESESDDITSKKIHYGKSIDGGATFNSETTDLPISTGIRSSTDPYILADLQNNIYVIWRATRATAAPFYYEVFFSGSTDGGANWTGLAGPILVDRGTADGSGVSYPAVAITSEGNLAAVWNETPTGFSQAEIFASYSYDGGVTWTGNTDIDLLSYPDGHGAYRPDIFVSRGDTLHVFWNEGVASSGYYDIHYSKGDTLGTALPVPGTISGQVFEQDGTTPIADVFVETFDSLDQRVEADTTDAAGAYQVSLYAGTYRQHFSKEGYDEADLSNIVVLSGQTTPVSINMVAISGCQYIPGDINSNGFANGIDVTYGVAYLKGGTAPPDTCFDCPAAGQNLMASGDVNGNCAFNGIDITYYVAYLKGIQPSLLWCENCPPATRRD